MNELRQENIDEGVTVPPKVEQQKAIWTTYNRYPTIFTAVAHDAPKPGKGRRLTVLSYGCSTGEEAHTLATRYFPDDNIIGLDISEKALAIARERFPDRRITYDRSAAETLERYGPYDIVFAMSVLCRWPQTAGLEDCSEFYTFDEFARSVADLDRNLRVGGLLVVYNANFSVLETETAARYEVVKGYGIWKNGFVHRFGRNHKRDNRIMDDCIYRKLADL